MWSLHCGRQSRNLLIRWQHCPHGENELYNSTLIALLKGKIILGYVLCRVEHIYSNNNKKYG